MLHARILLLLAALMAVTLAGCTTVTDEEVDEVIDELNEGADEEDQISDETRECVKKFFAWVRELNARAYGGFSGDYPDDGGDESTVIFEVLVAIAECEKAQAPASLVGAAGLPEGEEADASMIEVEIRVGRVGNDGELIQPQTYTITTGENGAGWVEHRPQSASGTYRGEIVNISRADVVYDASSNEDDDVQEIVLY